MIKRISALALALAMSLTLVACGGGSSSSTTTPSTPSTNTPAASAPAATGGETKDLTEAFAESPILVTSGGQSADYQMIATVMGKVGMDYTVNNLATSADLGAAKTLIVVVGGSSKGLGAAGIDADQELVRVGELIDGAKAAGLSVIAMHTGGEARRGDLSDKFITPIFEKADYAIVVTAGDADGLMAGVCAANGIPMSGIKSISEVTTVLPAAFK